MPSAATAGLSPLLPHVPCCLCCPGEKDDTERFLFFSRAALELLLQTGKQPDVLHCHDWQSATVVSGGQGEGGRVPLWWVEGREEGGGARERRGAGLCAPISWVCVLQIPLICALPPTVIGWQ